MDDKSYDFVSKNPKTPEYAVHILNQHIRQWYAHPMRSGGDRYEYEQLLPHGDSITTLTNLYRKNGGHLHEENPGADWEWNNDDDYLVTSTQWSEGSAIFYDYDDEKWHLASIYPAYRGAWIVEGSGMVVMDANTFPEAWELATRGPELTFAALASAVEGALLHSNYLSALAEREIKRSTRT